MKPADINQILQPLSEGPAEEVSLMALARSTGKSLPELQKFLQTHRVCFIETGQTKYKLNPNPSINGLLKSAQLHIEIQSAKKRQQQILSWAVVSAAILVAFTLLVGLA
jgi:hypothetical protein